MARRESKWTHIYWDFIEGKMKAYIRFVPDFMNTEAAGFSHGISVSGNSFDTAEEANIHADRIDKFMDEMEKKIIEEYLENSAISKD